MLDPTTLAALRTHATVIRRHIIRMVHRANSGHVGGSLSATEIVVALYFHLMRHDPQQPRWAERDRFILSKGHCTPVFYATLAECGYFCVADVDVPTFWVLPAGPSLSAENTRLGCVGRHRRSWPQPEYSRPSAIIRTRPSSRRRPRTRAPAPTASSSPAAPAPRQSS